MNSLIKTLGFVSIFSFIIACGSGDSGETSETANESGSDSSDSDGKVTFNGSVVSAFTITVDGIRYDDSEDFYTQEVMRLPSKVAAAGYSDWNATFDAVLGFNDLARDMMVYIAPTEKRGYSGQAAVGTNAKFLVELPTAARDSSYNVRAVKRVNVLLTRAGETKRFCYNFSAVDKNVPFNEKDKPIVLDTFVSKLTLYACESQQTGGIVIPSTQ